MGKVTDHQALVHRGLALDADAGPALAAVRVIDVGGVDAEGHGIGSGIDGDEACGRCVGVVLVSVVEGARLGQVANPELQISGNQNFDEEGSRHWS